MAIFLPAYKPTYYEASGDTLSYYITTGDETIFTGKAWKNPSTNTIKIRLDEIFRDYLKMETENRSGDLNLHPDAFKYFYLYDASGYLLQGYGVLYDWGKEFDGSSMVLSDPIKPEVPFNIRLTIPITVYCPVPEVVPITDYYFHLYTDSLSFIAEGETKRVEWSTNLPGYVLNIVISDSAFTVSNVSFSGCDITAAPNETELYIDATASIYYDNELLGVVTLRQNDLAYVNKYLTAEMLSGGTFYIGGYGSNSYYRQNGGEWVSVNSKTTIPVSSGDIIEFKSKGNMRWMGSTDAPFKAYGNIESMEYGDNFRGKLSTLGIISGTFSLLSPLGELSASTLVDAENVVFPAISGSSEENGYQSTFKGCSNMVVGPKALNMSYGVVNYGGMFDGCSSLRRAPEMKRVGGLGRTFADCTSLVYVPDLTDIENGSYYELSEAFINCTSLETPPALKEGIRGDCTSAFENCTSLKYAPVIPLCRSHYFGRNNMFKGCTSLKSAPDFQDGDLLTGCNGMFSGCTSLEYAPAIPRSLPSSGSWEEATCYMFAGCTSMKTAPEMPTSGKGHLDYMFKDCTSLTVAPELPLSYGHSYSGFTYEGMFMGCTSLVTAPTTLPSLDAYRGAYKNMFYGCTSLRTAPDIVCNYLPHSLCDHMFYGCTSLTDTAVFSNYLDIPGSAVCQSMYENCTSLTAATGCYKLFSLRDSSPGENAYKSMFKGCTSLVSVPLLNFSAGDKSCQEMFEGCTSLDHIRIATNWYYADCYYHWLKDVAPTGTLEYYFSNGYSEPWPDGPNGKPNGWTAVRVDGFPL